MQIFPSVRQTRNDNMLDILAVLSTESSSTIDLDRKMDLVYSSIWENLKILEEKGFVHVVERKGRVKIYDITVKGALACIFSEHNLKPNEKTLEKWKKKDWGVTFRGLNPFIDVNKIDELKEAIENMYVMSQVTLEDISNDFLKKIVTNPIDAMKIFRDSKISITRKIEETGEYILNFDNIPPGSCAILKTDNKKAVPFIVSPDKDTHLKLKNIFKEDPFFERVMGLTILKTIQILVSNYKKGNKITNYHYNKDNNNFIISGEFPDIITTYLKNPEQILQYTINSYNDIISPFLENRKFVNGEESIFNFRSLKYDPVVKTLDPLSKEEILSKAEKLLKQINDIKKDK